MALSIRWRLTLWNTLALTVVLTAFALGVYGLVSHALYRQIDRKLRTGFEQLGRDGRLASQQDTRLAYWLEEFRDHDNLLGAMYGPDGTMRAKTPELAADAVPARPTRSPGEIRVEDQTVPVVGRQRVMAGEVPVGEHAYTVVLMAPLADVERELGDLRAALTTAVPLAVLASVGLGYWLARTALAPMERLRTLTERITADRLDRRLPVANPKDEVGRLARTINEVLARLERSFAEVRRFTADASHELRTPLTAIRTEAEVALRKPLTVADHQQLLGSILEECDRLTRLADQLLTLARDEAGVAKFDRHPVDLAAVVCRAAETMRAVAEARRIDLRVDAEPTVLAGDEPRLRQVVFNLLDNAIKYTPEGGTVTARLDRQDSRAVLTVADTGVGIPADHLPHVFDRFYRVDKARSREMGGTGLGLSIARSIVQAHDGQIDVASVPGRGTTFTVAIPLTPGR